MSTAPAAFLHLWWRNCSPTEQLQLCDVGGFLHVDHHSLQELPQRFHCDMPFVAQIYPGFLCDLADIIMQKNTTLTWVFLFITKNRNCRPHVTSFHWRILVLTLLLLKNSSKKCLLSPRGHWWGMCIGQYRCTLMSFWDLLREMAQFRSDETSIIWFPAEVKTLAGIMWMIFVVLAAVNSVYKMSGARYGGNSRTCWWVWTSVEENIYSLDANMSSRSHLRYCCVKWAPKKESAVATPGMII